MASSGRSSATERHAHERAARGRRLPHNPRPIGDIDPPRFDIIRLFVTDAEGWPAVMVPVARRGSREDRWLIAVHPDARSVQTLIEVDARRHGDDVEGIVASAGTRRTTRTCAGQ